MLKEIDKMLYAFVLKPTFNRREVEYATKIFKQNLCSANVSSMINLILATIYNSWTFISTFFCVCVYVCLLLSSNIQFPLRETKRKTPKLLSKALFKLNHPFTRSNFIYRFVHTKLMPKLNNKKAKLCVCAV